MAKLPLSQVDVFSPYPHCGNPVAVVHDADGLSDEQMAAFARWTNLSETTFLLQPTHPEADYRLRIVTPGGELPFAGHPTLGSCHAWLEHGGSPSQSDQFVQECAVGLVSVQAIDRRLGFAAPALRRSGPLERELLDQLLSATVLHPNHVVGHQWVDNGPGWCALLLDSAQRVLSVTPEMRLLKGVSLGLVGPQESSAETDFEVRAFVPGLGVPEDPVTGSLNASIGQWLIGAALAPSSYVAAQGTAIGRKGRVHVAAVGEDVWVSGDTRTLLSGTALF